MSQTGAGKRPAQHTKGEGQVILHRFQTADDAIAQLEREKFQRDGYDPSYPWRSYNGLVSARVRWDGQSYVIDCMRRME